MCSIFLSTKEYDTEWWLKNLDDVNYYNKFRGPDDTNIIHATVGWSSMQDMSGRTFEQKTVVSIVHNLLAITGNFTKQPFIKDKILCLYNGEVYNYKSFGDFKSDGESLIYLYETYGDNFTTKIDGEFAIVLLDTKKDKLIISSDIFKTKPLFYCDDDGLGVSTYGEPLRKVGHSNVKKFPANTTRVYKLSTLKIINEFKVYDFDLNQHKNTLDDWNIAFEKSIKKRTSNTDKGIFLGLSSGYDSGVILCELIKQNTKFKAYSVIGKVGLGPWPPIEDNDVLKRRHEIISKNLNGSYTTLYKDISVNKHHKELLHERTEEFDAFIESSSSNYTEGWKLYDNTPAAWISLICNKAIKDGKKVYLSGMGADEIFSDYGFNGDKIANHSNFGGYFPSDLKTIFPWKSFYNSTMESYLAKEEYASGMWGVETRYPFLDKDVVQEFLWLNNNLKNKWYKSVLHNYLTKNNFPFNFETKMGF